MCVTTEILVLIRLHKKADLIETKCRKDRKVHAEKTSFDLGKNGHHQPSSLGDGLIVVVRE